MEEGVKFDQLFPRIRLQQADITWLSVSSSGSARYLYMQMLSFNTVKSVCQSERNVVKQLFDKVRQI